MYFKNDYESKEFIKYEQKVVEILSLLSAVIAPAFGFVWILLNPELVPQLRTAVLILTFYFAALYFSIKVSVFAKENLRYFLYFGYYLASAFVVYLAYTNLFINGYSLLVMLVSFYILLTFLRIRYLIAYLFTMLVLLGSVTLAMKGYGNISFKNSLIAVLSLLAFSAIAYLNLFLRIRFKEAVSKSEQNYQTLLDASPDGIVVHQGGKILYVNDAISAISNYSNKEEIVDRSIFKFLRKEDYDKMQANLEAIMNGLDQGYREEKIVLANNTSADVEIANIVTNYNGKPAIMSILRDISQRKKMEQELIEAEDKYRKIVESALMGVYLFQDDRFIYINEYIEKISGYIASEFYNMNYLELFHEDDRQEILDFGDNLLKGTDEAIKEIRCIRKDGNTIHVLLHARAIEYKGKPAMLGMLLDITDRKSSEKQITQMALYDSLTGMPNRYYLGSHLSNVLKTAADISLTFSVLFIDLDGFKLINDTMGHSFGDKVLKSASKAIKSCLDERDFIARYGGDEFVIIIENTYDGNLNKKLSKIMDRLSRPLTIREHEVIITPSIGISLSPEDSQDAETLIKYADSAMYQAKSRGRNSYVFFSKELHDAMTRRMQLENGLRRALKNDEFMLYYQPQVDLRTSNIYGAEALLRWMHPNHGIISPDEFIPLAEETGLIVHIGEWVLKNACRQCKAWQEAGLAFINIAVNVSTKQLIDRNFVNKVRSALEESGLESRYLELEITESILMEFNHISPVLQELKLLGLRISIDDFGVGYSSLSRLQNLTIDNIKIDKSFTAGVLNNPKAAAIVKTTIAMGENLDFGIIAEGVETREQMHFLKQNNCHIGQGYFFSIPLPADDFEKFLADYRERTLQYSLC